MASGREDIYREQTLRWLQEHEVAFELLIMRPAGDFRKDAVIKKEIFMQHIEGKYYVGLFLTTEIKWSIYGATISIALFSSVLWRFLESI